MPIRLRCSNGHSLEVEDRFAGSFMECPMCGCDVQVGAAPPPPPVATLVPAPEALPTAARAPGQAQPPVAALVAAPVPVPLLSAPAPGAAEEIPELSVEDDEAEPSEYRRPRRKPIPRREPVSAKMRRVSLGLTFFYVEFLLLVAALCLHAFAAVTTALSKSEGLSDIFASLFVLALVAKTGVGLAGAILCCIVPRKSELRPLAITLTVLEGISVVFTLLGAVLAISSAAAGIALAMMGALIGLGGWVTFMVFLSHLSRYLDDETTAAEVKNLMVTMSSVWGAALVLAGCFAVALRDFPHAFAVFRVCLSVGLIGFHVKIMGEMLQAINRIRKEIAPCR